MPHKSYNQLRYQIAYNKLAAFYPEIAKDCEAYFPAMNKDQVKAIFEAYCQIRDVNPASITGSETTYLVAVFIRIFDPDFFYGFKSKLRTGLRPLVSAITGRKKQSLSYYGHNVLTFNKLYKRFPQEIEAICQQIRSKVDFDLEL